MKKMISFAMALAMIVAFNNEITAQETEEVPGMVLKTNPLSALGGPFWLTIIPVTGEYRLLYEVRTLPKQSVMIGASYVGPSLLLNLDDITSSGSDVSGIKTSGYKLQGMYKFFITRSTMAPEGFYVGPHLSFASATIKSVDNPTDRAGATKLNVNGVLGYQLISESGFALDIYTGLGFRNRQWTLEGESEEIFDFGGDKASATVAFGLNFGFAF